MAGTTKTAKEPPKELNPLDLLEKMSVQGADTKRSKSLAMTDATLGPAIDQWAQADTEIKRWEALKSEAAQTIIEKAKPERIAQCRKLGRVETTIKVNGRVSATWKDQYSKVPFANLPRLQAAFGDTEAQRFFKASMKISMTEAATQDEDLLRDLIKALGPDRFSASFTVTRDLLVTSELHTALVLNPEVERKAAPFVADQTIKQYSPALRV